MCLARCPAVFYNTPASTSSGGGIQEKVPSYSTVEGPYIYYEELQSGIATWHGLDDYKSSS